MPRSPLHPGVPRARGNNPVRVRGFTLLELGIVLVVVATVIALAVPRMVHTTQQARATQHRTEERTLSTAVDWFRADHNGRSPAQSVSGAWDLSEDNLVARLVAGPGKDGVRGGPYLDRMPVNPFNGLDTVRLASTLQGPKGAAGWVFVFDRDDFVSDAVVLATATGNVTPPVTTTPTGASATSASNTLDVADAGSPGPIAPAKTSSVSTSAASTTSAANVAATPDGPR